jgi:hypothetical protein
MNPLIRYQLARMQRLNIYLITLALSAILCKAGAQENQGDHVVSPSDIPNTEMKGRHAGRCTIYHSQYHHCWKQKDQSFYYTQRDPIQRRRSFSTSAISDKI